jgi:hypothetical protein
MRKDCSTTSAQFSGEVLRHAGLEVVALPGVLEPGGLDHHLVAGLDLGRHVGQPEEDPLVLGDLLAEGLALLGCRRCRARRPASTGRRPARRR